MSARPANPRAHLQSPSLSIRRAEKKEATTISAIVNHWATLDRMLPRSPEEVSRTIGDFVVAVEEGRIVGCGALALYGYDLAEIRSVAVRPEREGLGIGARIVRSLLDEADVHEIPRVIAFTYVPKFFEKLGFRVVPADSLPRKAWTDCVHCPKRLFCDEVAMERVREGDQGHSPRAGAF